MRRDCCHPLCLRMKAWARSSIEEFLKAGMSLKRPLAKAKHYVRLDTNRLFQR